MQTYKTTKIVSAALISLLLAACGGGEDVTAENPDGVDTTSPVAIGSGSGSSFDEGVIAVGIGDNDLPAGGSTSLTVNIVSSTNTLVNTSTDITFNSPCIAAGEAILSVGSTLTNKVTAPNGEATITYKANGCVGTDVVTATAKLGTVNRIANATLTIESDTVQAIEFVDATPTQISLKGTGGTETSNVRFKVTGSTSAPIKNVSVSLVLNTSVGGLCLAGTGGICQSEIIGITDKNGLVSATVQAGTKPTSVRVTATDTETNKSTQSSVLYVSTGIPDQDSMSLSTSLFNPKGWDHDGVESSITIRMADQFNNPPPDGTAVTFLAEGGSVDPGCITTDGTCTVKWKSQNPRPNNGRVTILATALGNESFTDQNANGQYDEDIDLFNTFNTGGNCDPNSPLSTAAADPDDPDADPCDDLVEAYLDKNENGVWDVTEDYIDLNVPPNGTHDTENGIYDGVLCPTEGAGCTKNSVTIRDDIVIVMSADTPMTSGGLLIGQESNVNLALGQTYFFTVTLMDINGNSMPFGTKISLNTTGASNVQISQNFPSTGVANTTGITTFTVTLKASDSSAASGNFDIRVEAPDLTSSYTTRINNP